MFFASYNFFVPHHDGAYLKTCGFIIAVTGGLVLEIISYPGRIMGHDDPFLKNLFLINIICLTRSWISLIQKLGLMIKW